MGGKTVALKMTGLFVAMTYCGMQLPSGTGTCIGRFERVVADIGDEQSLVSQYVDVLGASATNARGDGRRKRANAGHR